MSDCNVANKIVYMSPFYHCKSLVYVCKGLGCKKKKKIAAREFRVWSPTTLLGLALSSLTTVDRTGNGAFC